MVDGKRGVGMLVVGEGAKGDKFPGTGGHVNGVEGLRTWLEFRRDFQHDVILLEAYVDVGDRPLVEGVARYSTRLGADPCDNLVCDQLPLVQRLELSEHAGCAATAAAASE